MPRKFVISPTKLRIWNRCPAEYRLEYIDRIGRFYHRARAGFAFGHSLHRALETFHAAGGAQNVNAETLEASLDAAWVAKGYAGEAQESEFKQEATRILTDYHAAQVTQARTAQAAAQEKGEPAPEPPRLFLAEKSLRLDLTPEIALTGRVDRVDEHPAMDNALEIVDYKSGRTEVAPEDVAGRGCHEHVSSDFEETAPRPARVRYDCRASLRRVGIARNDGRRTRSVFSRCHGNRRDYPHQRLGERVTGRVQSLPVLRLSAALREVLGTGEAATARLICACAACRGGGLRPRPLERHGFELCIKLLCRLSLLPTPRRRSFHAAERGLRLDARGFAVDAHQSRVHLAGEA